VKRFGVRIVARIGLETGEAVVGHVGSDLSSAYTAVGEPVGLATRWERANQLWGTFILAGEATWERARGDFLFREVDLVLGGASAPRPVRLYELLARKGEKDPRLDLLGDYEAALALYRERRFDEACQRFARLASEHDDAVSAVYVGRCRQLAQVPPPADWDGVFEGSGRGVDVFGRTA
jgi:adenylate cyclase